MLKMALFPLGLLQLAAAGAALGAGWKLGAYLAEVVTGEKQVDWSKLESLYKDKETGEPLWKRQFTKPSEAEEECK